MKQIWSVRIFLLCLATFLTFPAHAQIDSLHSLADQAQLSSHPDWLNLLHFKNGVSEIDDPKFFFAPNGKQDPHAELHASLDALITDTSNTKDSVYCKHISRSTWLIEQLPQLAQRLTLPECQELQEEWQNLNPRSVTLVLASAHINSPASAFGHTFLRIDTDQQTPLTSYAVNYAAQTLETNGFIYAYQGIFGGYEGRYSMLPYSKKVQEYSDLEQRDIWEHTLNLSQEEVDRLTRHIFEIRHFYADYFFVSENCSYNLLWLLQIARPGTDLISQFDLDAIPIDTVRAIEQAGFIFRETYRPSNRKRMTQLATHLTQAESWAFVKNTDYDLASIESLPVLEKISALELAVYQLKRQRSQDKIDQSSYSSSLLKLLKARSQLGNPLHVEIEQPASPRTGHLSSRIKIGVNHQDNGEINTGMNIGFKLAYHDIYDHENGYLPGAYISFFDTQIVSDGNTTQLDSLHVVDIRSYALQDNFFKPISWQVDLGAKRLFDDALHGYLKSGAGITLGHEKFYVFTMLSPALYVEQDWFWGASVQLGLIGTTGNMKLGLQLSKEWFELSSRSQELGEVFATYQFDQNWALNIKHEVNQLSDEATRRTTSFNIFYYF